MGSGEDLGEGLPRFPSLSLSLFLFINTHGHWLKEMSKKKTYIIHQHEASDQVLRTSASLETFFVIITIKL